MNVEQWHEVAETFDWMVPWRYLKHDERWFVGGYTNVTWNVIDRHLARRADQPALRDLRVDPPQILTYRDLYGRCARLARWWAERGVQPGDRIFIAGEAEPDSLVAWLAAQRIGAVVVRSTSRYPTEAEAQLRQADARWLVSSDPVLKAGRVRQLIVDHWSDGVLAPLDDRLGTLDPIITEANTVGCLIYGDDPEPHAYSGIGALMGWTASLTAAGLALSGGEVGIATQYGGLRDRLIVSLAVLASGGTAVWTASHDASRIAQGVSDATKPSTAPRGWLSLTADPPAIGEEGVIIGTDMSAGVFVTYDNRSTWAASPSRDLSGVARQHAAMEGAVNDSDGTGSAAPPAGVREMVVVKAHDGSPVVWIALDEIEDAGPLWELLRDQIRPAPSRIVRVDQLPRTREGRVARHALELIAQQAPTVPLHGLADPEAVRRAALAWQTA